MQFNACVSVKLCSAPPSPETSKLIKFVLTCRSGTGLDFLQF